MKVTSKNLPKSQLEIYVELSIEEFAPYIQKGAAKISRDVKIAGFRPGKAPFDIIKAKIGEMSILEEASKIAINKTLDEVFEKHIKGAPIGQPQISVTKLAPQNPLGYKVTVALLPKIELGPYKNLKIKKEEVKVDGKEIEKTLEQLQEMRVVEKIVDRAAKDGDKAIISIQMFLDKVPVDGGQTQETAVILGKDYIIPGFDKQLIGMKKGDEKEFKLPYPKDHHMKNLAGKIVEFKVKIKEVYQRELPKIDDAFAKTLGLNTLEILKKNMRESIEAQKKQEAQRKTNVVMIDKIVEKARFSEIPELLINNEVDGLIRELEHNIASQGGKFEDYLASMKKTRDQLTLDMLPGALKKVKGSLLIKEIAVKERIKAETKEVDKREEILLKQYKGQKDIEDRIKSAEHRNYLKNIVINDKTIEKLREWNLVNS